MVLSHIAKYCRNYCLFLYFAVGSVLFLWRTVFVVLPAFIYCVDSGKVFCYSVKLMSSFFFVHLAHFVSRS